MSSKSSTKVRGGILITIAAYAAVILVVVYTIFLIASFLQLEKGLIAEDKIVQELKDASLEGAGQERLSAIEQELGGAERRNRELRLRNTLITVGASSVIGVILIAILILFIRRTKELYHQRAQIESTLLGIGDGLIVTNEFGQIVLVNPAFENMLGWSGEEVRRKYPADIIPAKDENQKSIPSDKRLIAETLNSGTGSSATLYYQRKDGSSFPAAVTVSPVIVGARIVGAVEVFRDITRQKEIEKAKDTFISIASHQFRTPLTSIRWLLEILITAKAGKLKDSQMDIVKEAHGSVLRLNALTAELLNVSRIETGRLQVSPEHTDIIKLAEDAVKELQPELKEKNVNIKKEFPSKLPKINVDALIVRQVMLNILSNAVKYSYKDGTVIFTIKKEEKFVRMEVEDNGIGIPKKDRDKIFGRFFRASNAGSAREAGGTGLGLFLAKKLVELSGGSIGFESEENKGTKFWFTLPLSGSKAKEGDVALSSS